jgi:hypothetical protein
VIAATQLALGFQPLRLFLGFEPRDEVIRNLTYIGETTPLFRRSAMSRGLNLRRQLRSNGHLDHHADSPQVLIYIAYHRGIASAGKVCKSFRSPIFANGDIGHIFWLF